MALLSCMHAQYPVQVLCQVLGVSRSAYYSWQQQKQAAGCWRGKQKANRTAGHSASFRQHRRRYGARRIAAELKATAMGKAGRHTIRKIMSKHGLAAIQPRSFVPKTTDSRHSYAISPNLLLERSAPQQPDEVWVGDITYIPLAGGTYGYLSVWMDLYSRRIIGWQLDDNMKEELVIASLKKAMHSRKVSTGADHSLRPGWAVWRQ